MQLHVAVGMHGNYSVLDDDPDILRLHNIIYSPFGGRPEEPWGIYDHGQKAVMPCLFWQGGPNRNVSAQQVLTPLQFPMVEKDRSEQTYIYVGLFHEHYGHFLLSTFCRYWATHLFQDANHKLLFHSDHDIAYWFAKPHIAILFAGLGLSPDRFVRFEHSVALTEIIIPCPSFEETGFAHRAFVRSCNALGAKLAAPYLDPNLAERPIYLSKTRLERGVARIINEDEFVEVLDRNGITIIYPEALDLAQQIALFYNHNVVAGQTGSAFHTSVFAPGRAILGLGFSATNFSSYYMIDDLNGTNARYTYPMYGTEHLPGDGKFYNYFRLTDPKRAAESFLTMMSHMARVAKSGGVQKPNFGALQAPPVLAA
jgi:hypothetical protein